MILSTIKTKLIAFGAGLIGFLLLLLKIRGDKIDELEHNEKIHDKIAENREKQTTDRQEALENEKQTIEKRVKSNSGKSRRDIASKL